VEKLNQGLPTRQQFVELVRSYLETLLKTTDLIEEDTVYQELVLNLRAGDDVISVIKLNPPYNLLVDLDKVSLGRVGVINLEQLEVLLNSLKTYWDYSNQSSFLAEIKAAPTVLEEGNNVFAYEL